MHYVKRVRERSSARYMVVYMQEAGPPREVAVCVGCFDPRAGLATLEFVSGVVEVAHSGSDVVQGVFDVVDVGGDFVKVLLALGLVA